jgi:hypothetical protein
MRMYARTLCASFILACFGAFILPPAATAQVAGPNVNMVSGTKWPTGDPFLQRQNEPSMAVSTRNPMHILAGANDYRTVDLELALSGGVETGDAWLGLFKSFDGGLTWQSTLLPGCVQQSIPQCKDNGALGGIYQAASDPVVRAGTNGMFYYAGLAFDRATSPTTASSVSSIFVARYNDLNNNENLDPITYIDTHIVAMGESSKFLDKPSMAVDIPRAGASTCSFTANEPGAGANGGTLEVHQSFAAGNVYIAYTDFLTPTKANTTPTHLMFTHSTDCGVTWSAPVQINTGTTTSQGSAIAVNPLNGHVYVAWRQFSSTGVPDAIMMAQSGNAGRSFSAPVRISTFQPFDQGTTGTSFRTNAYPSITTDFFGFVYVAFSARGLTSSGDARVVAAGSIDGAHWTPAFMVDNPSQSAQGDPAGRGHQIMPAITFANGRLTLLYYDLRLDHYQGLYTPNSASLTGYDEMLQPEGELALTPAQTGQVFNNYIDDAGLTLRRHTLDLRVLELGIFPTITLGPSVLVSQYAYGCCVNPNMPDIKQFKFNVPNLPLFAQGSEPFLGDYIDVVPSPQFVPNGKSWAYNFAPSANPLFHATWTDNRDVVPPADGNWQNYTPAVPVGTPSVFQPGSTVPSCQTGQEGMRNQNIYTAQITGGLIVGAPGNAKPLGTTTFNGQTVPFQRAFAVEAQNVTSQQIFVRFSIANQPTGGSASFLQFSPLTTLDITIPAFSSVSRSVFVTSTNPHATVTVNVTQISAIGGSVVANGLSATAVLNPDITNPNITNPNITNPNITNPNITNFEVTNPNITNPNITNPNITNPNITNPNITNPNITNPNITNVSATNPNITNTTITNPDITNPNITNPNITNPDITNGSIQDVVYPITNDGNTTATYTVKTATFSAPPSGIVLQLIINKLYQTPVAVNCQMGTETHWNTVANITAPKLYTASDPQLGNPNITNAAPNEASVTLAPSETAYITVRVVNPTPLLTPFNPLAAIVPVTVPQAVNTQTVLSNPGTVVFPPVTVPPLVVTTATLPDGIVGHSFNANVAAQGGNPGADTWSVSSGTLPNTLVLNTATGAISGTLTAVGTFTFSIQVKDTAIGTQFPQHTVTQSFTVHVASPLALAPVSLPGGTQGTFYSQTILPTGGLSPVTVSLTSGAVPTGLVFKGGTITGTPTATGTSNFTVQATDSSNPQQVFTQSYSINIVSPIPTVGNVVFTTQPANSVGGQALAGSPVLVTVTDNTGAVIPGVPVTMSFNGAPPCAAATLGGSLTVTTNPVGVATFSNLSVDRGQNGYTLAATVLGVTAVSSPFNVSGYCDTGSMNTARRNHIVLTLPNGKILLTGGAANGNATGALTSAELYDPVAHTFTTISPMNVARADHAMTLLPNGTVLVTGGFNDTNIALQTAEIFNPTSNTFTLLTAPMISARAQHTSTLLANGKVLLAGGNDATGTSLASAEIFDPVAGTFTASTHTMNSVRQIHHADLLPNGKVLISGGFDTNANPFASAEIYDPVADTFTLTGSMGTARGNHASALLYTGKVLVAGGLVPSGATTVRTATAEVYDPVAGTFSPTGSMSVPRAQYFAMVLDDGTIFISGTAALPAGASADIYNPASGTFSATSPFTMVQVGLRQAVAPDGTVLLASGVNASTVTVPNSEIFYPPTLPPGIVITTPTVLPVGVQNQAYTQVLLEHGAVGQVTWSTTTPPPGLALSANGIWTGTPTQAGTFNIPVQITDSSTPAQTANGTLTLVVTGVPVQFTSSTMPTAGAGRFYSQPLPIIGGTQPYTVTQTSGTLPGGLSLSSNGVLKGTPSAAGSFTFTVHATDSSTPQQTATQTFTMAVNTLFITTTVLPDGIVGVPYNATISTSGGTLPLSFSVTTAAFPPGLLIQQPAPTSQNGALAGTPTQAGTFDFSESVVDSSNPTQTVTQNYVVTIALSGTAAPASVTFVAQPQPSIGGQILSGSPITVRVADANNAAIAGALVALSFNGAPPCSNAILSGTLSAVTGSNGQASFSDLSVDRGGFGYNLLASAGSASAVSAGFRVQGFCGSGNLSIEREFPAQAVLGNGKVLIAGGADNNGNALNTAELYDPATGTTSPTGNLSDPNGRVQQVSVVLPNGKVLLAGGSSNVAILASAELYDPATGTFTSMGSMSEPRFLAEAVLLADGRVLVSGGFNTNVALNTAEIYDPATGSFTRTGNMNQGRGRHTMTLLPNGKVLVTGGRDAAVNFFGLASAEIFDPSANQGAGAFTLIGNMNSVRFVHTATLLSNGTVLIAGGFNAGNESLSVASAEIFDPSTNTFTLTGSMNITRARFTATLLPDGTVLMAGGINSVTGVTAPAPSEIYSPATGAFTLTGAMITGRELPRATELFNGNVLVTGGDDGVNILASTELYYNTVPIAPIVITATTIPNAFVGQPYVAMALEQNGTGPITWSIVSGTLPPGLAGNTIGTYGVVTGTPTTAGSFTFTAQVTDGHSVATRSFTINVSVATLVFTSNIMPTGGMGRPYSQPLPVTGGTLPYTATVTSGSLPPGLALRSVGVLSGTPSSAGSFTFTVKVTDSSAPAQSVTQTLTMAVNSLFITTTALPSGIAGVPYNAAISTTGGTLPLTFSAATGAFPPGLTIQQPAANPSSGALSGTPTLAGHYTFTESVTDSSSPAQAATQYYTMDVFPAAGNAVPANLTFLSQPQNSVGGQILGGSPVRVHVTDAKNLPIAGASVALSFNGPPPCSSAVLSGTLTGITNGNGNAVFPDLSVDRGQLGYTLLASAGSASAVSQTFTVNGFCQTGNLSVARRFDTATLLQNGKVLITGGASLGSSSQAVASAELYDPSSGQFTLTGSMNVSREFHTATLLLNGKVLIAGGDNSTSPALGSAELYDPATGAFTLTGSMSAAHDGHTATLLAGGRVLIAGGYDQTGLAANSAELYDPASGTFAVTGNMVSGRGQHTASLLANGTVLLAGGVDINNNILATAEIYDPSRGVSAPTGSMSVPRIFHTQSLLPSGKVLVAGGTVAFVPIPGSPFFNDTATATAELYDPTAGTFSLTGSLITPVGAGHAATVLTDGNVLVTNGGTGGNVTGTTAEVYSTTNGTFALTGSMPVDEIENTIVLLNDGTVLDTGGSNISPAGLVYYSTAPLAAMQVTTPTTLAAGQPNTTVFSNPTAFGGAATNIASVGFNGILNGASFLSFNPLFVSGLSFSTPLPGTFVDLATASFYPTTPYPADFIVDSTNSNPANQVVISIPNATRAVGLDFGALGFGGASSGNITLSNGFVLPLSSLTTVGHTQFAGFVSATPITSLTYTVTNDHWVVLDVLLGTANVALPNATQGQPYAQILLEQGGVGPLTWSLAGGTLPPGISLSSSGILLGTPTANGAYSFSVHLVDSSNPQKSVTSATLTLNVVPVPPTGLIGSHTQGTTTVNLGWSPSVSNGVVGYNVYRALQSGGPFTKVNASLDATTNFTDSTVSVGNTYFYVVTAVGNGNVESVFSGQLSIVVN